MSSSPKDESIAQQINDIIKNADNWRGDMLLQLRTIITSANTDIIEEVKWKKPSKPSGVPVWSCDGIVCVADILKNAVRLTFPKGAMIKDPNKIFNTRLESNTVRAVDFFEDDKVDKPALKALVLEAVKLNTLKKQK